VAGGRRIRAPAAPAYLPASFTSATREELRPGSDVSRWAALRAAIENRAGVYAVGASLPGALGQSPGFFLLEAADFGRGADRHGFLAVFVPRGWLTVALEQDPRTIAIGVDGRRLEGGLGTAAASAGFQSLGHRWVVELGATPLSAWSSALPWLALALPSVLALAIVLVGRGVMRRRRAERDFERIFRLSPDLLGIAGFDGRFRRVNPAFEATLGYSTAELLAMAPDAFVHPDDHGRMHDALEQLASGEEVARFENRAVRSDGAIRQLEWSARPLAGEGLLYMAARDVTDRRRTEGERELLAQEQAALRRVATLVARDVSPDQVLGAVVSEARRLLGTSSMRLLRYEGEDTAKVVAGDSDPDTEIPVGAIVPLEGDNMPRRVQRARGAARQILDAPVGPLAELARRIGLHEVAGAPVWVEGRLWGVMIAGWTHDAPLPDDTEERMSQFTELVAVAIANAEGRSQLTASRTRVIAAADESRRRIERDLHDATQQRLVSLTLDLRATEAALPPELTELKARLAQTAKGMHDVLDEVQEISRGIHPAVLTTGGLRPALRTLARRSSIPVELALHIDRSLPKAVEVATYFMVSEALTNAAKHAEASCVQVELEACDAVVELTIRDDGVGGADPRKGSGLVGLRDRVDALGGTIDIASPPRGGTALSIRIPVTQETA
jgi:PAS domain S-box-containing protein